MILSFSCKNFEEELPVISYNNTDTMNMNLYVLNSLFIPEKFYLLRFTTFSQDLLKKYMINMSSE